MVGEVYEHVEVRVLEGSGYCLAEENAEGFVYMVLGFVEKMQGLHSAREHESQCHGYSSFLS